MYLQKRVDCSGVHGENKLIEKNSSRIFAIHGGALEPA